MTQRVTDSTQRSKLDSFVDLFEKWNRSINLSAATTRTELLEHVTDSLEVVPYLEGRGRVLDVGSGGGFPVVIAAICLPAVQFTALEPVHKKHAFLRTAARELGLANLEAHARRLDDHDVRDYDAAMSRATFDLAEWLTRGSEFVVPTGVVLGFEAVPRDDLPPAAQRHSYELAGKQRAIIVFPRST
jgi:16S rRNA (guanine527-N7)-methyltransferase